MVRTAADDAAVAEVDDDAAAAADGIRAGDKADPDAGVDDVNGDAGTITYLADDTNSAARPARGEYDI